ncbi:hypothetical protein ACFSMW_14585 [Virgibacillus halophilus]|uniref:Spore coat protein W n=1 Tax=Tigheibacillus halophilus TaxID=361280 RepID=A0ABU5C1V8_9BACI|nr:hypothetical protein [Virgibacillus halophilus]
MSESNHKAVSNQIIDLLVETTLKKHGAKLDASKLGSEDKERIKNLVQGLKQSVEDLVSDNKDDDVEKQESKTKSKTKGKNKKSAD